MVEAAGSASSTLRRATPILSATQLASWGALFYSFAVVAPDMTTETGWTTAQLSVAFALGLLVSGLAAPGVAGLLSRPGPRSTMAVGSIVGAVGMTMWALAPSLPVLYLAWLLIGLAMAATLYEPALATLVALGGAGSRKAIITVTTFGGAASTLFAPLTRLLADAVGWRTGIVIIGGTVGALTASLHILLPRVRHWHPTQPQGVAAASAGQLRSLRNALVAEQVGHVATMAFLVAFLVHRDVAATTAAGALAATGLGKIVGRPLLGAVTARARPATSSACVAVAQVVLLGSVMFLDGALLLAVAALAGAASGLTTILRPLMVVDLAGVDSFAATSARLQRATVVGRTAGPLVVGATVAPLGWELAWMVSLTFFLASALFYAELAKGGGGRPVRSRRARGSGTRCRTANPTKAVAPRAPSKVAPDGCCFGGAADISCGPSGSSETS